MKSSRKPGFLLLLLLFAVATLPLRAAAEETGTFDRTLNVSGSVDLDVRSGSGNITVHTGPAGAVHVYAKVKARDSWLMGGLSAKEKVQQITSNPPIEQQGNTIRIGRIEDHSLQQNVSIDYDLTVPAQTKVTAQTGSGDQKIDGVQLPLSARTGSGNITLDQVADARVTSGSGDLKINSVKGALSAETGSGNIVADGVAGSIVAHSGSGEIELNQVAAGDINVGTGSGNVKLRGVKGGLRAETGSGDIEAEGEIAHDWRLGAGSGNIRLKVPSQASFDLDAKTSSGSLKVNHPVTMQGTMSRNHIQGKVGNGGVMLEVHTGSGDIYVD